MPISSNSGTPDSLSISPDVLPQTGYTSDQLTKYIFRQLGYPTWEVELTTSQVQDCIQDALGLYSQWCPRLIFGNIRLVTDQSEYLKGADVGMGIAQVDFVEPNPVPTEIFYGNLITPAPLFRTGADEYDMFLRWRKTFTRITSIQPQWTYDDNRKVLYIHNPIERYHAGITAYGTLKDTSGLSHVGAQWVKEYSLARARNLLGEVYAKFGSAIPSPIKDLQLDSQKRDRAEKQIEELMTRLRGMQLAASLSID